ncbi:MAG: lytic murein transglycosylase B, partial [Burkholderiaceae bacterium]
IPPGGPLMNRRDLLALLAFAAAPALAAPRKAAKKKPEPAAPAYSTRPEVAAFIAEMVETQGFDAATLARVLDAARYSAQVEKLMQPPMAYGIRNWFNYRSRFLDDKRIAAGLAFWDQYDAALARAQATYGVPAEVIAAIIGVETYYGRITGNFRVLDALMTLSFDYTRRAEYFRKELANFLVMSRDQRLDPLSVRGSFAGAIGWPQFMPGSVRAWGVDFDGDGRIDLNNSPTDAIGSIANFLVGHGWVPGLPILIDAAAPLELPEQLGRGIEAKFPWNELQALGVASTAAAEIPGDTPLLLVDLPVPAVDGGQTALHRLGTKNFAAILGYNRSYFYAAAVTELAAALAAARKGG